MKALSAAGASLLLFAASAGQAQTVDVGPQTSTYSGSTRGYFFVAPTAFTITGVQVALDASTAAQNFEIVRFNTAPTIFPTTTNDFVSLARAIGDTSSGFAPVSVSVLAGQVIGFLGDRGGVDSYGTVPYLSSIGGLPITLTRLGEQDLIANGPAHDLFTESPANNPFYSRVAFTYNLGATGAVPEPASWALMIAGFGLAGAAMRRRTTKVAFAA